VLHVQKVEAARGLPQRSNTRPDTSWTTLPMQGVPPRGLQEKASASRLGHTTLLRRHLAELSPRLARDGVVTRMSLL